MKVPFQKTHMEAESLLYSNHRSSNYLNQPAGATKTGENALPISSGPIIASIIGTEDNKIWRDTMVETGMYWLGKQYIFFLNTLASLINAYVCRNI